MSSKKLLQSIFITNLGFLAAIAGNYFIPQVAKGLKITKYNLYGFELDLNIFYRLVLIGVIVIFLIAGITAYFKPLRREKYIKQSAFRFALGIALLIFDIAGTKLRKIYYWVYPVLKMTGIIPAVAWMPFALTLFPTPFLAAVFLIAICSWFPVASQTAFGIQTTEKSQFEAARTLGAKTPYLVFHVAVPHAMPQIFAGITTACASSFTCRVIAEMMGQPGGLGYYINLVKVWAAYYKVFAAILLMALMFSLILAVLNVIKSRVLRWQKGQFK